jgi:hypothetical protein
MFKHAEIALAPSQSVATNDDLDLAIAVHRNTGKLAPDLSCHVSG